MNLIERIEYLFKQQGQSLDCLEGRSALLQKILVERRESAQQLTDSQRAELAEEIDCPLGYLTGNHPFDDIASLEESKGDISIHLKLFMAANKKKQDILYDLSFLDYLRLVDQHISKIDKTARGLSLYYKE